MTNGHINYSRSVGEVIYEVREELKDFIVTRIQMLRSELAEKVGAWKAGVPSMAIGALLLLVAFLLLTAGFVNLIALAFAGQPWGFAVSFFIVMAIYGLAGGLLVAYGWATIKAGGLTPKRTLRVLKEDQDWFKSEARTQI